MISVLPKEKEILFQINTITGIITPKGPGVPACLPAFKYKSLRLKLPRVPIANRETHLEMETNTRKGPARIERNKMDSEN